LTCVAVVSRSRNTKLFPFKELLRLDWRTPLTTCSHRIKWRLGEPNGWWFRNALSLFLERNSSLNNDVSKLSESTSRQVPRHATRQQDDRRGAASAVFPEGKHLRKLVKGKLWLLLSRWVNLTECKRQKRQKFSNAFTSASARVRYIAARTTGYRSNGSENREDIPVLGVVPARIARTCEVRGAMPPPVTEPSTTG